MFKRLFKRRGAKANKPRERPTNPGDCYHLLLESSNLLINRLNEKPFNSTQYLSNVRLPFSQIESLLERLSTLVFLHKTKRPFSFTDVQFETQVKYLERWLEGKNRQYLSIQDTFLEVAKVSNLWASVMIDPSYIGDNNNLNIASDLAWELYLDLLFLSDL